MKKLIKNLKNLLSRILKTITLIMPIIKGVKIIWKGYKWK